MCVNNFSNVVLVDKSPEGEGKKGEGRGRMERRVIWRGRELEKYTLG